MFKQLNCPEAGCPNHRAGPPNNGLYFPHKPKKVTAEPVPLNVIEDVDKEIRHVAFLKVHKTASSTAQNVFLRFGDARNLTFVLAHTKGESGWLNVISYTNTLTTSNVVPPPRGRHFDLLCCHVIYNRRSFEAMLPKDTFYVGIVREPVSRFQSAVKYFSPRFILKIPGENPLETYAKDPVKYEPIDPKTSFTNNRMALEFGFPMALFPGKSLNGSKFEIKKYLEKLDKEFNFIIISEMFEESMVMMKRILNWGTKDILYVDKNVAQGKLNTRKLLPGSAKDSLQRFLYLDTALYDFAVKRFKRQVASEGDDFNDEVASFKTIQASVRQFCSKNNPVALTVKETKWNSDFTVAKTDCKLFFKHEKDLIQKQRLRMYGTLDN
ncbi:G3ST3-like protein [Mya arenaria]|uniref:G3ST3-like protein n=1 Tax=Mya arenaria TaxID=6604 RepID=A0ABY7ECH9_MYAAR|nr:G3ST3-like protein [Mya arenaria]